MMLPASPNSPPTAARRTVVVGAKFQGRECARWAAVELWKAGRRREKDALCARISHNRSGVDSVESPTTSQIKPWQRTVKFISCPRVDSGRSGRHLTRDWRRDPCRFRFRRKRLALQGAEGAFGPALLHHLVGDFSPEKEGAKSESLQRPFALISAVLPTNAS
ncbi:hypothetical protein P171DRAFT_500200 [Karstenula rhodostoma CBS 690.94]|uniref:Uncharacterized protein n=1 Tax=Karstenula rhodostoma CBS 690.94 TaxID=1392251 RepID=A0A9P4PCX0_9PLEO|nr:hypothetical protein P171DRAFT_500200 [Karstenula rhodostoma CBS 690.94]